MTPSNKPKILLVEDNRSLANLYMTFLEDEDYQLAHVETGTEALANLKEQTAEIVLLDLMLPDMDGMEVLKFITDASLPTTVLVVTAYGSVDRAVKAMRGGAYDFLVKPFNAERLIFTLRNALERQHLTHIIRSYEETTPQKGYAGFIGNSPVMQEVYRVIKNAAPSRAPIFVTGESGTGKEVCAQAVHQLSPRRAQPFIAINCAALPPQLIESEIFGHVKGAFTGAVSDRKGAAQRASSGTLFLDEIGEMDFDLQAKLLRFVQTGSVQPIGSNKIEKVDVRIICATNRDPMNAVKEGRLREDLFYRLHVIPIHLPPLQARREDILDIAQFFLNQINEEENKKFVGFTDHAKRIMHDYSWPGNVRELQNIIRQVIVLNDSSMIKAAMIAPPLPNVSATNEMVESVEPSPAESATIGPLNTQPSVHFPPKDPADADSTSAGDIQPLWQIEKMAIEAAIDSAGGNITLAAAKLQINPSTIYRKRQSWPA